jgi:hypothetical protein
LKFRGFVRLKGGRPQASKTARAFRLNIPSKCIKSPRSLLRFARKTPKNPQVQQAASNFIKLKLLI